MYVFKDSFHDMFCAYRTKYHCEHILIKLVDSWKTNELDDNQFAGTVLIDISQVFNCVPHAPLIAKVKAYCISNDACELYVVI